MPLTVERSLERALETLIPALDIVEGRVVDGAPPSWCEARGWTDFLLALSSSDLARCEAEGFASYLARTTAAPASLAALGRQVTAATDLPTLSNDALPPPLSSLRKVAARKQSQLGPLLSAMRPMAIRADRIVDVGAGRGHLTRIAAALFDREALGLELLPERVAAAEALAAASSRGPGVRFVAFDACREELSFARSDFAVGLHACGEVGDRMVLGSARAGCDLTLVSCCLQKIGGQARAPLSRAAQAAGFVVKRDALGLTNLTPRPWGVEGSLEDTMAARERRLALRHLLRVRGLPVAPGEEMRGINRRRAHADFPTLAARVLALRGLPQASPSELTRAEDEARQRFAEVRRLALPRSMIARLTEVAVVLDRAAALADAGHAPLVATLVDASVTPRNLALFASLDPSRLPRA